MRISIIHPTRGRDNIAFLTMVKWLTNADRGLAIEYILSVDKDDPYYYEAVFSCNVLRSKNTTAIQAINSAAKIATGDLFVVISDDFDCPEHWDTLLLIALDGKQDFCAKTDDGLQPTLITMPVMDRVYYERYGYVYYEGYKHMFADQELTSVAMMTGKYIKLPLLFPHLHYSVVGGKDAINTKNDATWQQGERLFNERLKNNFGIDNPVMPYSEIKWR